MVNGAAWLHRKVPLTWKDRACRRTCPPPAEGTCHVKNTSRRPRITVTGDASGVVSQAGALLLTQALRVTGLDRGLSAGLGRWRPAPAVHDPGEIIADLAGAPALGRGWPVGNAMLRAWAAVFRA